MKSWLMNQLGKSSVFKVRSRNDFLLIGMVKRKCVLTEDRQTLSTECGLVAYLHINFRIYPILFLKEITNSYPCCILKIIFSF